MSNELQGRRITFLTATEGVEQVELTEPWKALEKAGAELELLSTKRGKVQAFNHLDKADTFPLDNVVSEADPTDYDGLVLPGGVATPDQLRMNEDAVHFVRTFSRAGKAGGAYLPCAVDTHRGRNCEGPDAHVLAFAADRHPERRR